MVRNPMLAYISFSRIIAFISVIIVLTLFQLSPSLSADTIHFPTIKDFSPPESVNLCGEPIPLENRRVWEMLDREFTISVWNRFQVTLWLKRAGRYFPYIDSKLEEAHMPLDLKYLAVAESSLLPGIRSRKGAVGTWQFLAETARRHGLRVDRKIDERRSVQGSTVGAIRYLRSLKEMFGSWTLALAAYNCGEKLLEKEIKEQKVGDYHRLNLPLETERFIFRIVAIKVIMTNPERYGYNIAPENIYRPIRFDTIAVTVDKPLSFTEVAQTLDTDFKIIKEMNPHILGYDLPKGKYPVYVPSGSGPKMADIMNALASHASYKKEMDSDYYLNVQQVDISSNVPKQTGAPVSSLK
jgi:hypothetical protein